MVKAKKTGTRQEVFDGIATMTAGKLTKDDLIKNSRGTIVSKRKSDQSRKRYALHEHRFTKKQKTKDGVEK